MGNEFVTTAVSSNNNNLKTIHKNILIVEEYQNTSFGPTFVFNLQTSGHLSQVGII